METKDINKQEYQLRINKVTDYIHNHIDQPLSLQKMAGIACFSPFHFHRVFTILTGETPTDYIKRTRIEKAALLLKRNKELSATEIARLCGFKMCIRDRPYHVCHCQLRSIYPPEKQIIEKPASCLLTQKHLPRSG